jgi:hypothetical protein
MSNIQYVRDGIHIIYQQAEASDTGKGGGDGGTRESELTEMTDKHD